MTDETTKEEHAATIRELSAAHAGRPGGLLPLLHAIQAEFGYIPSSGVAIVAEEMNLSRAEVHGVITFYHLFRTTPPGKHTLYLCRAEACQSMGARELEKYAKDKLGIDFHQTTEDGSISLEPIYCLGNCACSPAVMIDRTVHGRVSSERLEELLEDV